MQFSNLLFHLSKTTAADMETVSKNKEKRKKKERKTEITHTHTHTHTHTQKKKKKKKKKLKIDDPTATISFFVEGRKRRTWRRKTRKKKQPQRKTSKIPFSFVPKLACYAMWPSQTDRTLESVFLSSFRSSDVCDTYTMTSCVRTDPKILSSSSFLRVHEAWTACFVPLKPGWRLEMCTRRAFVTYLFQA